MLSEAEKEHVGNMFFIQRKTGTYAGDKNYIANQNKAKLPDNWDEGYRNIVISIVRKMNLQQWVMSMIKLGYSQHSWMRL